MKTIFPIILIVAVGGVFFFQIKPMYSEVQALRADAAAYDHALEMATELGTLRGELSDKYESFSESDLARLNHFLPSKLDTVRIILDIDGIGARNGIKLKDIKVSAADQPQVGVKGKVSASLYQTVTVSFGFTAGYNEGLRLMRDLERSLRLLDSTSVKIQPADKSTTLYNFDIGMRTYWVNK